MSQEEHSGASEEVAVVAGSEVDSGKTCVGTQTGGGTGEESAVLAPLRVGAEHVQEPEKEDEGQQNAYILQQLHNPRQTASCRERQHRHKASVEW